MTSPQKRHLPAAALLGLAGALVAMPASADADDPRLDALFERLGDPENAGWERAESEIGRIWARSGSPSMDFLLSRGRDALEAENYVAAVGHFSALIDHAPDFAEAWNGRATAFFLMEEYALAIADIRHVLALNPRHFDALSGLAIMLESMGETAMALDALYASQALHPHREDVNAAVGRLERMLGRAEL
jgi:tetratricopeptide (TPR) repeat protein